MGHTTKSFYAESILVTLIQVKNKWKISKKTYKKKIDHNNATGIDKMVWEYLDDINVMFWTKASTTATALYDSGKGNNEKL